MVIVTAGASFRLGKDPYLDLTRMAKKYGEVFSLMLGNRLVVVLNGVRCHPRNHHQTLDCFRWASKACTPFSLEILKEIA